jgi:hypothetical protein
MVLVHKTAEAQAHAQAQVQAAAVGSKLAPVDLTKPQQGASPSGLALYFEARNYMYVKVCDLDKILLILIQILLILYITG